MFLSKLLFSQRPSRCNALAVFVVLVYGRPVWCGLSSWACCTGDADRAAAHAVRVMAVRVISIVVAPSGSGRQDPEEVKKVGRVDQMINP